jgi:hypothetical protein
MKIVLEVDDDLTRPDDLELAAAHLALQATDSAPDMRRAIAAEVTRRWLSNGRPPIGLPQRMATDPGSP